MGYSRKWQSCVGGYLHEGTDLKQNETAGIAKVERGQRQYALFAA